MFKTAYGRSVTLANGSEFYLDGCSEDVITSERVYMWKVYSVESRTLRTLAPPHCLCGRWGNGKVNKLICRAHVGPLMPLVNYNEFHEAGCEREQLSQINYFNLLYVKCGIPISVFDFSHILVQIFLHLPSILRRKINFSLLKWPTKRK